MKASLPRYKLQQQLAVTPQKKWNFLARASPFPPFEARVRRRVRSGVA